MGNRDLEMDGSVSSNILYDFMNLKYVVGCNHNVQENKTECTLKFGGVCKVLEGKIPSPTLSIAHIGFFSSKIILKRHCPVPTAESDKYFTVK